ncbi:MAG: threonylcarbamoyl-AMP synthase [Ectothiorhodospiraceae bacterium]|nr:threonylcarbamoyl-AMP synthase [Chromatiales bacterium]MCP5155680.1 threonylcarbamoyl-AMP synthase [Ectothiorhodospiraceae bacterium]
MPQSIQIHPTHPQRRLITQAVAVLRSGGVIAYPTDSCYALGCCIGDKSAMERIRRIRGLADGHHFTLMCRDLSEIATYARVDNAVYRLLRAHTPGPYTFVLRASREVPRRLQDPKRRTIGLRVPGNPVAQHLLDALGEPMMSVTLHLPGDLYPTGEGHAVAEALGGAVDLVIDAGTCGIEPTSVVDLSEAPPRLLRRGLGDVSGFAGIEDAELEATGRVPRG